MTCFDERTNTGCMVMVDFMTVTLVYTVFGTIDPPV